MFMLSMYAIRRDSLSSLVLHPISTPFRLREMWSDLKYSGDEMHDWQLARRQSTLKVESTQTKPTGQAYESRPGCCER